MTDPEPIYTAQQVAALFQINPETVFRRIRSGQWPYLRLGPRCYRFTEAHVEQILALTEKQPVPDVTPRRGRRRIVPS